VAPPDTLSAQGSAASTCFSEPARAPPFKADGTDSVTLPLPPIHSVRESPHPPTPLVTAFSVLQEITMTHILVFFIFIFIFILIGILFIGIGLVWFATSRKNKFGINFTKAVCPNCQVELPANRKPANLRQFLWGGWTCGNCGCETDKWAKRVQQ
jgi:hypothetical protein